MTTDAAAAAAAAAAAGGTVSNYPNFSLRPLRSQILLLRPMVGGSTLVMKMLGEVDEETRADEVEERGEERVRSEE